MAKMTWAEIEAFIGTEIRNGLAYSDSTIATRRERNASYYALDLTKDLPAAKGQSAVVDGTLPSQIGMLIPQLMRVMTGGPQIFVYEPNGMQDEQACKMATDYVNDVVMRRDNCGEDVIYKWAWDGLVQIVGIVKAYWQEDIEKTTETYEGLTDEQLVQVYLKVQSDPRLEITAAETTQEMAEAQDPVTGQPVQVPVNKHSVTVEKTINRSKVMLDNVPPEEFVISRDARTLEDAVLKSHRTTKTAAELEDMGYSRDVIDTIPDDQPLMATSAQTQRYKDGVFAVSRDKSDPSMRELAIHQGIVRCNYDNKGVKDWYFVAAGTETVTRILEIEEYHCQVVFADFCSDPLPHTFYGRCTADNLIEPMKAKTATLRQTLQNLYLANTPLTLLQTSTVTKGTVEGLTNRVPGGLVPLVGDPSTTVREVATPFFAQHTLPMLAYFDEEAEKRSGVSRASMGLDPEVLQNQSATAAAIAQSASMGKVEMIARIWATGGMRKLGRGILKILKKYQDFTRQIMVANQTAEIDPRQWAEFDDWDCTINTGLGTGSRERDLTILGLLTAKAEQLLLQAGPQNGIVSMGQYSQMLSAMAETAGIKNPERFFTKLPIQYSPQPQPPQPTPDAMVLAQVEGQKLQQKTAEAAAQIQSDERIKMAELASKERLAIAELQTTAAIEAAKHGIEQEKIKVDYAKLGLDGIKTDIDATLKGSKEGREQAKATIDFKGLGGVEDGLKGVAETMKAMSEKQGELAALIKKPRRTRIERDAKGKAVASVQELQE